MSGRLIAIVNELNRIDPGRFQTICDIVISLENDDSISFNRIGSQLDKHKTTAGTPDTLIRTKDGLVICIEYTTKADDVVSKLCDDIDSCLDSNKVSLQHDEIEKILLGFNSKLKSKEEAALFSYAHEKNVKIELFGIDRISTLLYSKYLPIACDLLDLSFDTGQILSIDRFISEYTNRAHQLATPLNNSFFHRDKEIDDLLKLINENDLIILSGNPGLGKTKLALEVASRATQDIPDCICYVIDNKGVDILSDLRLELIDERPYLLIIDDANRHDSNLIQLLSIIKEDRKHKIKLLLTIRDYALNELQIICSEFQFTTFTINPFDDDEIVEILEGVDFNLFNKELQQKILALSEGNIRLAIMSSRLAINSPGNFLYGSVYDIYKSYFQSFIQDFNSLEQKNLIKTLGLVSFFQIINIQDKAFLEPLFQTFEIISTEFEEAIFDLRRMELLEIKFDHARISEQVMASFFFYKVFIDENLLSFKALLENYFDKNIGKFQDAILGSNNKFLFQNVYEKIRPSLQEYRISIIENNESIYRYLDVFWLYESSFSLSYIKSKIEEIEFQDNNSYDTEFNLESIRNIDDQNLQILFKILSVHVDLVEECSDLAFEYCRRKSDVFAKLMFAVSNTLTPDPDDFKIKLKRQLVFVNFFLKKLKEGINVFQASFCFVARYLLRLSIENFTSLKRKGMMHRSYSVVMTTENKELRMLLWQELFNQYYQQPENVMAAIKGYMNDDNFYKANNDVLEFDKQNLIPFVDQNLNKDSFEDCLFVHDYVDWLNRHQNVGIDYKYLKNDFKSSSFQTFRDLDWSFFKGKEDYKFEDEKEFKKLKKQDIQNKFVIETEDDIDSLIDTIQTILKHNVNFHSVHRSITIILTQTYKNNGDLGLLFLRKIFDNYNPQYVPEDGFLKLVVQSNESHSEEVWNIFCNANFSVKSYWKLQYFTLLPEEQINRTNYGHLWDTLETLKGKCFVPINGYKLFEKINDNLLSEIMNLLVTNMELKIIDVQYPMRFFERSIGDIDQHILEKAYLLKEKNEPFYESEGLNCLIKANPKFLVDYISKVFRKNNFDDRNMGDFSFMWDIKDSIVYIEESIDIMVENYHGFLSDHPINLFFKRLQEPNKIMAVDFIKKYIEKNSENVARLNAIIDVIKTNLFEFFEEFFLFYISINSGVETYKQLEWARRPGVLFNAALDRSEYDKKAYLEIIALLEKTKNRLSVIEIKNYLTDKITQTQRSHDWEIRENFIYRNW